MKHFLIALTAGLLSGMPSAQTEETEPLTNIYDLEALLVSCQDQFLPIAPPSDDVYIHSRTAVLPIKWSGFPRSFKKGMVAEIDENDFPLYRVSIYEDVQTRDTVFLNGMGVEVYRLTPKAGYNPYAYQMNKLGVSSFAELAPVYDWWMDPAKVAAEYVLIPSKLYEDYQTMEAYTVTTEADAMAMPMMMAFAAPMSLANTELTLEPYLSGPYSTHYLDLMNTIAGQSYEIYFTHNLKYYPFSTNGTGTSTAWLAQRDLQADTTSLQWHTPLVGENGLNRSAGFFKAYESVDTDGDGLSDIYELMMTRTDPNNAHDLDTTLNDGQVDSDGDGLSNMQEYLGVNGSVFTHPQKQDSDADSIIDSEDAWPMDPAGAVDTDGDRLPNSLNGSYESTSYPQLIEDDDDDNDRFSDVDEGVMGTDKNDASSPGASAFIDSDADGLFDWQDPYPNLADGDGDGISDGYEVKILNTSPMKHDTHSASNIAAYTQSKGDADSDGRPQWIEASSLTNPNDGLDFETTIF